MAYLKKDSVQSAAEQLPFALGDVDEGLNYLRMHDDGEGGGIDIFTTSDDLLKSASITLIANESNLFAGISANQASLQLWGDRADLAATDRIGLDAPKVGIEATVTTAGTTGAQTIDKAAGSVNFAPAATSVVVTNSTVTEDSLIFAQVATNDATMTTVAVVAAAGSFTLHGNAPATAETRVNFWVLEPL